MRSPRNAARIALVLASLLAAPGPAVSADGDDAAAPIVGLDQLLKLPSQAVVEPQTRGGATRAEWRSRFENARKNVVDARAALAQTRSKLADVAGETSAWKMGAPGLGNLDTSSSSNEGPLDYALSNEMRNNREELERSERHLTELGIEANLAGVPESWRPSLSEDGRGERQARE